MEVNMMSPELGLVTEITRSHLVALVARFPNASSSADEFSALTFDVPLFLGYMLAYFLNGILFVQVFVYFISFRRTDPRYLQIIVLIIFLVECVSTLVATEMVIYSIITKGYLSFSILLPAFEAVAVLTGVGKLSLHVCPVYLMVHFVYSFFDGTRVLLLAYPGPWRPWAVIVVIVGLSLTQCVTTGLDGVLGSGTISEANPTDNILTGVSTNVFKFDHAPSLFQQTWLIATALCDIIITCTILYLQRRILKVFPKGSQLAARVKRLMSIAIDTGMITAVAATLLLLFFLIFREGLIMLCLFYPLPKLYANCGLATLNARLAVPGKGFREDIPEKSVEEHEGSA
ncbi:hypothetical protein D9757_000911 [Collybiopsis confluens]|uniref:DUF6534 domain-containing protein n=1 Tax=Collybiopsis confluens TaxID=2823264 RepID=A0A8H5I090_9AGAR|nr:hypothetical protein D9757_000911 [Collybiopsis confluens]